MAFQFSVAPYIAYTILISFNNLSLTSVVLVASGLMCMMA